MKKSTVLLILILTTGFLPAQTVSFQADKSSGCMPLVVNFTDQTTGSPVSWTWDFGDGSTPSHIQHPIKTFVKSGTYNIKLTVTYADSSTKDTTYYQYIHVSEGPNIQYTFQPDSICPGTHVQFQCNISSKYGIADYVWDFKDGGMSTQANPSHRFDASGTYRITLKVTDTLGCSAKDSSRTVLVKRKPKADFSANDSIVCIEKMQDTRNISFINQSSTDAAQFLWDFDNGKSSTQKNPTETFSYGDYDITLIAIGTNGCLDTLTKRGFVSINFYKATYTVSDTIICSVPGSTTFTGTGGKTYRWSIYDSSGRVIAEKLGLEYKPVFQQEGVYRVRMAAANAFQCKDTAFITIHVYDSVPLKIDIHDNPHCFPDTPIIFINNTTYRSKEDFGFESTVWNTGDGYANLVGDTVSHVYGSNGKWPIHAYITTPYGCTYTYSDTMRIFPVFTLWKPYYSAKYCIPFKGGAWQKELETSSPIVQYIWIWGDGDTTVLDTTDLLSYHHVYDSIGSYIISLTIKNAQGCTYTHNQIHEYTVGIPPKTTYIPHKKDSACVNDLYLYLEAGDSTYRAYDSLFVNGVFVGMDSINKPTAGVYTNGWSWVYTENGELGAEVLSEYKIDTLNAKKKINKAGNISLLLIGYFNGCPGDTLFLQDIGYVCPGVAKIKEPRRPYYCDYPTVHFQDGSDGAIHHLWHFGNDSISHTGVYWEGDTSTETNPVHQYTPGKYLDKYYAEVKLWVSNDDSIHNVCGYCEDSTRWRVYISHADLNLAPTNTALVTKNEFCTGDTILFWDSTQCTAPLIRWYLDILDSNRSTTDTLFWLINHYPPPYRYTGIIDSVKVIQDTNGFIHNQFIGNEHVYSPFPDYTYEIDSNIAYKVTTIPHPYKRVFMLPGVYYIRLNNVDILGCGAIGDTTRWPGLAESGISDSTYHGRNQFRRIEVFPHSSPAAILPKDICARDTIRFFDSSSTISPYEYLKITQHVWSCIGVTRHEKDPSFVIPNGGVYDISYLIVNEKGCDSSIVFKKALQVNATNATWITASGLYEACNKSYITCVSKVSTIPAQSTALKYDWYFNNGNHLWNTKPELHSRNVTCAFDVDSTQFVQITLVVTDTLTGCRSSYTDSILIRRPVADFTASQRTGICPPLQTAYTDLSHESNRYGNSELTKWEWYLEDKDDTVYSLIQHPGFVYNYAGYYDAKLVVTDNFGCTDTAFKPDYIYLQGPYGRISNEQTEGCVPLTVKFTVHYREADSLILITGDGNNVSISAKGDSLRVISYTYLTPGYYFSSVQMFKWVTDSLGNTFKCSRTLTCEDTIWAIELTPDFTTQQLYCKGTIPFTNLTDSLHGNVKPFDFQPNNHWDYGNGKQDSLAFHGESDYDTAGTYYVTYTAEVKHCRKAFTQPVVVMDFPDIRIQHRDTGACFSVTATLEATDLCGEETLFNWHFDDGTQWSGNPIQRQFSQTGRYPYTLDVDFSPANCHKTYHDTLQVFAWIHPTAAFEIQNAQGDILTDAVKGLEANQTAYFNDLSQPGDAPLTHWVWHIGNGDSVAFGAAPANTSHLYDKLSGYIDILLAIEDGHTCKDTIQHQLLVLETITFPNVFSPNGDGLNDYFHPLEAKGYFAHLEMVIYNRWGERVWSRTCEGLPNAPGVCPNYEDETFWWNGKSSTGKPLSEGVYFWVFKGTPLSGNRDIILNGSVTLVR